MRIQVQTLKALVRETATRGHLLTVYQVTQCLGVSRQRIYTLIAEEKVQPLSVFGVLMVGRKDVELRLSICQSTNAGTLESWNSSEVPASMELLKA